MNNKGQKRPCYSKDPATRKDYRITLRLPAYLLSALELACKQRGKYASLLIREVLEAELEEEIEEVRGSETEKKD